MHERALRLVCKDSESELEIMKEHYVATQQHNLHLLIAEVFTVESNINKALVMKCFTLRISTTL